MTDEDFQKLLNRYRGTRYEVSSTPSVRAFILFEGTSSQAVDAVVRRRGATRWAYLTAYNPGSVPRLPPQNHASQSQLLTDLAAFDVLHGRGVGEDASWAPEPSFFVLGISREEAVVMGTRYGQVAILVGEIGKESELVICCDPRTQS